MKHRVNTEGRYSNPVAKLKLWLKNWRGQAQAQASVLSKLTSASEQKG